MSAKNVANQIKAYGPKSVEYAIDKLNAMIERQLARKRDFDAFRALCLLRELEDPEHENRRQTQEQSSRG